MSKKHLISKAIVVMAIALLLFACSHEKNSVHEAEKSSIKAGDSVFLTNENNAITEIKKNIEAARVKDGDDAARLAAHFQAQLSSASITQEQYERIKSQLDQMYMGIGMAFSRHQLDLALMQYTVSVADKVRPLLAARIKTGQKIPADVSVYLRETLMADFEQTSADAIKKDQTEIEFWNAEKAKWLKSWEEKNYDYVLPQKPRGQFLFDFESDAGKGQNPIKSIEDSLNRQLKKEIDKAIKESQQGN